MLESRPKAEDLQQLIEAAFAEVKYPGDDRLVYDNSGNHLECNQVATAFRHKHWRQVPLETLRRHSAGIFFFSPEAYRFYLPAYLLAAAFHYDEADTIHDSVVFSLIPPSDGEGIQVYRKRMEILTPEQRRAITSFLEFLKQQHPQDDVLGDLEKARLSITGS